MLWPFDSPWFKLSRQALIPLHTHYKNAKFLPTPIGTDGRTKFALMIFAISRAK